MAFADKFYADGTVEPAGYRQITGLSAVKGVQIGGGRVALIQTLNANIRIRDDGVDPTPTEGYRLAAGQSIWYLGDLRKLRFIEESVGAEVNLLAYK
jgi:hypothetical protein